MVNWRGPWRLIPQIMSKYLSGKHLLLSKKNKKTGALAGAVQKIDYLGPHFRGPPESLPKNFWEAKLRLLLNNFTQKLDFVVLWFRRRSAYKV